jgi:ABC-type transport system substrate-binding protein
MKIRRAALTRLATPAVLLALALSACAPQPAAPPKAVTEPTKPAAAPAAQPAASPVAAADQATPGVATAKAPTDKRNLVVVAGADIGKLDPHMSTQVNDITISFNIFDSLTTRDPDLKLIPQLATDWKNLSEKTWEFKLRPGVKFHNGDPLTSADVKFSIERTYDPNAKTLVATVFTTIESIDAPDELTVRFNTKQPDPLLPARLGFYGGQIIPEKYFKEVGPDGFNQKPIGSGVVKFKEWVKDDHLTLEANKEYWGGAPDFDTVTFKPVPEPAPRIAALLAGEADIITKVPIDQIERIKGSGRARVEGAFYAGLYVLGVNSKVPPLDNPTFKQGLSYAIDREAIIKTLWRGQGIVPNGPVAKGDTIGYDEKRPPFQHDLNKARQLIQEFRLQGRTGHHPDHPGLPPERQGDVRGHRRDVEESGRERPGRVDRGLGPRPDHARQDHQGSVVVRPNLDAPGPGWHVLAATRPRRADGLLAAG